MTADAAMEHLVSRYLGGLGPAARRDIADWAGLPVTPVTEALARMNLRHFRDERAPSSFRPAPGPDKPAPVRFLPTLDGTLLVHAHLHQRETRTRWRRSWWMASVAGSWRYEAT